MCLAIMAEVEERLLRMDDFEDIVKCLKMDPATWSDDKLRGLLTAAYLSSVSEEEIQLACKSVTAESLHTVRLTEENVSPAAGNGSERPLSEIGLDGTAHAAAGAQHQPQSHSEGLESIQTLGGIDDLMKHELEQLTWAGPSGVEESHADALPFSTVSDQHALLRVSGETGTSGHEVAGCAHDEKTSDGAPALTAGDIKCGAASKPEDALSEQPVGTHTTEGQL